MTRVHVHLALISLLVLGSGIAYFVWVENKKAPNITEQIFKPIPESQELAPPLSQSVYDELFANQSGILFSVEAFSERLEKSMQEIASGKGNKTLLLKQLKDCMDDQENTLMISVRQTCSRAYKKLSQFSR